MNHPPLRIRRRCGASPSSRSRHENVRDVVQSQVTTKFVHRRERHQIRIAVQTVNSRRRRRVHAPQRRGRRRTIPRQLHYLARDTHRPSDLVRQHAAGERPIRAVVHLLDRVLIQLAVILHNHEPSDLRGLIPCHVRHIIRDDIEAKHRRVDVRIDEKLVSHPRPQELIFAPDVLVSILLILWPRRGSCTYSSRHCG